MKKILIFLILIIPIDVYASDILEINSDYVLIYDITDNKIIYDLNSEEQTSIASLTKIMTTITAIESINNLDEEVTITNEMLQGIYWNASKAGLKAGDKVTYRDLLYASMLPSGADATNSLAILISGSISNFVLKMNTLANEIGMNNTNFINVTGLDASNQYSNASDVLKLLQYALNNQTFKEIYTTKTYTLTNGLNVESTISNMYQNDTLDTSRIIGSKTGYTDDAGYCLASLIKSNNHDVILITLGAERKGKDFYHIIDTLNLIDYVDEELKVQILMQNIPEKIEIVNISDMLSLKKDYTSLYITIGSLLILIIFITIFCNKKRKTRSK